jgi:hypothetical protein
MDKYATGTVSMDGPAAEKAHHACPDRTTGSIHVEVEHGVEEAKMPHGSEGRGIDPVGIEAGHEGGRAERLADESGADSDRAVRSDNGAGTDQG